MSTLTDLRIFIVLTIVSLIAGCVSHSTASDMRYVRTLVQERTNLELSERHPNESEITDRDVIELAAQPLTLDNAIRIALLNNRDLRANLLDLGVARGQLVQASLFPNPNFEAHMRISQDGTQGTQWDLGVGINITDIILRRQRQGVAEAMLDAARFEAAGSTLDLGYQVRLAYYEVLANAQQLELMQTALRAYAASYDTAVALNNAGNLTNLNLSTEQAAYERARIHVTESEVDLIDARERLNILLGFFGQDTTWQISTRLPDLPSNIVDLDRLESRAIEASIELAEMRSTLIAAARRVGLTETAGRLPDINLGIHAEHDGTYWEAGPIITGQLPFFNRQQGNIISNQAEFDALRERYLASSIVIRSAIRIARAHVISAQERARHYADTILPLHNRIMAQTIIQYNAMQLSVFQLLQARRDQIEAGRSYVATLHEYWKARSTLEQLLAGRLTGTIPTLTESVRRPTLSRSETRVH